MLNTKKKRYLVPWQQFLENGLPLNGKLTSVTVGVFDGVHRGHQELIKRIVLFNADYVPVIVTFKREEKNEKRKKEDILSFQQRLELFERLGVEIVIVIDLTDEFKKMSGVAFLQLLLDNGNVGYFAVGEGFRCGHQLDTDAEVIQKFFASVGIPAEIVPQVMEGSQPISSSRIRAAIADGDITLAQRLLGDSHLHCI